MKVDWEELKRLKLVAPCTADGVYEFANALMRNFPAILAERSTAQRLRDAVVSYIGMPTVGMGIQMEDALANFDKETQHEG